MKLQTKILFIQIIDFFNLLQADHYFPFIS
jgi:hypothetical protein